MELFFKDEPSLKFSSVWDYFRSKDNILYMLHSRILKNNIIIGFKGDGLPEDYGKKEMEHNKRCEEQRKHIKDN